jgi:hypothetical protein
LAFVRDRAEEGHCVSVYTLNDFLEKVPYETPKHRLNDASVRLRTLEKSGYLRKVGKDYVHGAMTAVLAAKEIAMHPGPGRPPAIYAITEQGMKYATTIAEEYLDRTGKAVPRDKMMLLVRSAFGSDSISIFVVQEGSFRLLVEATGKDQAQATAQAWAKSAKILLKSPFVTPLPKEKRGGG